MRDHPQYLVVISSTCIRILGLHLHVNSLQVSVEVHIIQCLFSYLDLVEHGGGHGHNASLSQVSLHGGLGLILNMTRSQGLRGESYQTRQIRCLDQEPEYWRVEAEPKRKE